MKLKKVEGTKALSATLVALAVSLTACGGGNLESDNKGDTAAASGFPEGAVTMTIGQDPGGSTDLIGRSLAKVASRELGVPMPVVNKPGANGAIAAKELATKPADGQNVMVVNASLISITPLASSSPNDVIDIKDYEVVTGISQDDYVLVTNPKTGYKTVDDLVAATKPLKYGTTGVGTGSQLSQELLFKQAKIDGAAVPFDGGSPTLTAVLGNQVDVGSIQLGEAIANIKAGKLVPIVTFSKERNKFLPDVPTAVESGFNVPVSQYRAVIAPKGTPKAAIEKLQAAFKTAFKDAEYQKFNESKLLTPHEIDGNQVAEEWTSALESYRKVVNEFGIKLGEQ
jgi:tripartite-type tricarboxylate transporter receptor subunit TctC